MSTEEAHVAAMNPTKESPRKRKSEKKHRSEEEKRRKVEHGEEESRLKKEKKHKKKRREEEVNGKDGGEKRHKKDKEHRKSKNHGKHRESEAHAEKNSSKIKTADATEDVVESPFQSQTASLYLPLACITQQKPLEGICAEHLSPLILRYYPPLKGVILSYSNPRMSQDPFQDDGSEMLSQCIDEYAVSWIWVTADFLFFKPERGIELEGFINLENEGHIGIVCWNLFNATIERQRLPRDWSWVGVEDEPEPKDKKSKGKARYAKDGIGYFVNGKGSKVERMITFRVKGIESSHDRERGLLAIEGTMLEEEEEQELLEKENLARKSGQVGGGRRSGVLKGLGVTTL